MVSPSNHSCYNFRMKWISANFRSVLVSLAVFSIPLLVPVFKVDFDIATVLTVVSLFFAILIGFFLAAAIANHLRLQTLIADHNSKLMNIYRYVSMIDPSMSPALADTIDKYFIAVLDYDLLDFADFTSGELGEIINLVDSVRPKDSFGIQLVQNLHNEKDSLSSDNQEIAMVADRIVTNNQWLILIALSIIISFLLMALRNDYWLTSVIVGIVMVAMYRTLKLTYDVDSNAILAAQLSYEDPQELFKLMGKLPYFPETGITDGSVDITKYKSYRVGKYIKGTTTFEKEIVVVDR